MADGDRTRKAIADAAAGMAGSLVSMLAFYPIDVLKTNLQAGADNSTGSVTSRSSISTMSNDKRKKKRFRATLQYLSLLFRGLHFKTAHTVASSFAYFFIYSWIKSRHKSYYLHSKHHFSGSQIERHGTGVALSYQPSTPARLLLSAIAAVLNTCLTLPLDVLSARSQTAAKHCPSTNFEEDFNDHGDESHQRQCTTNTAMETTDLQHQMDSIWEGINSAETNAEEDYDTAEEGDRDADDHFITCFGFRSNFEDTNSIKNNEEEKKDNSPSFRGLHHHNTKQQHQLHKEEESRPIFRIDSLTRPLPKVLDLSLQSTTTTSEVGDSEKTQQRSCSDRTIRATREWTELWSGLWPSILLCSNPSINFTVFDLVKESILKYKSKDTATTSSKNNSRSIGGSVNKPRLNMGEAFVIGLVAKFAATIVTYPLIRAKIMLMVSNKNHYATSRYNNNNKNKRSSCVKDGEEMNVSESRNAMQSTKEQQLQQQPTMMSLLFETFQSDGILGLYKGCSLQLFHTLLKSALLMMVRERITVTTRRIFLK